MKALYLSQIVSVRYSRANLSTFVRRNPQKRLTIVGDLSKRTLQANDAPSSVFFRATLVISMATSLPHSSLA